MKKHLTDVAIQRYRSPKEGQTEIFDLGYPGLALRIGYGGAKSFVLFHRENGKLKRTTLGRWPTVSLAKARECWRRVAEGKPATEKEAKKQSDQLLFHNVVEDWLKLDAAQRNKASSLRLLHYVIDHDVLPLWRDRYINDIDRKEVTVLIDGIIARGAPVKARQVHAYLHRMFRWAAGRGIIAANPMQDMERPTKDKSRERVLSDAELVKVWQAADGIPGAVAKMLVLTGARLQEIAQLKWSEIDGDAIHLSNGRTKNGQGHIIPLSKPAQKLLASLPRIQGDYVFTYDGVKAVSGWSRNKRKLDAACGVTDWVYHDLRRTCATGLQKLGVSLQVTEAVLGHTSGSRAGIVGMYQRHSYAAEKRAALEEWGAHVMGLVQSG
jgi:integrase